jgi:formylglycine-generating enzyme required for sulfatase activity
MYLAMAYIEGKSLADLVRAEGIPPRQVVALVEKLAIAMNEAHLKGVIHRDLKPRNVMIRSVGSKKEPVIVDFGLARLEAVKDERLTKTNQILGTPAYMAPEQLLGKPDQIGPACDIYALGVVLYELLTGRVPFIGLPFAVVGQILTQPPIPPSTLKPGIDPALDAICLKAMAKEASQRYASMSELAGALAAFLKKPAAAPPVVEDSRGVNESGTRLMTPRPPIQKPLPPKPQLYPSYPPRRRVWVAAALLCVAVLLGIIYVATDNGRIKIEVNDPAAVVSVDGQEARIEGLGEPISLRAGQHDLVIKRGDEEVETRKFTVRRGDNPALVVTLEPKPNPAKQPPADPMPPAVARTDPPPVETPKPEPKKADPPPDIPKKPVDIPKPIVETPPPTPKVDDSLITNTIGMKLKLIPRGEFLMGSDASDPDARSYEKVNGQKHRVEITRPFYLGVYEVTQGEYKAVMGTNPSWFSATGEGSSKVAGMDTDRFPVEQVLWLDAIAFCNKLSEREGLKPCYTATGELLVSGTGYRLPTEAEWEYACRAGPGGTGVYSFSNSGGRLDNFAWYSGNSGNTTHAVGQKSANAFGLYDMHGNVWEWCQDWYDAGYYAKSPAADPQNSAQAASRVGRGGSWSSPPQVCRSASRGRFTPDCRSDYLGFRVSLVRPGS